MLYKRDGEAAVFNFGLSDAQRAELDAMSMEDLLASFRSHGERFASGASSYRGVSWNKNRSKWETQLRELGKNLYFGRFDTQLEAALAYDAAARKHHGA
ncbi:hypothetical protein GPECTOR_60g746 [Gonium pectorale]|uniref:AP2/ERF domain-containing protein n=1 Tax=Gonium pectorale TaxID=33097 RepID=A0A150G563_GONPE|nr:hypothetical protein GPECTOR_60g746 [Gonium pectorale]|eukprot:KXZ44968.1 hypothetical protein GPECTOR_60g746 [Gonium pectorale]